MKPLIDTSEYEDRKGKKPRGCGLWLFTTMKEIRCMGDDKDSGKPIRDWNSCTMFYSDHMSTYTEAKKQVLKRWPDEEIIYLQQ